MCRIKKLAFCTHFAVEEEIRHLLWKCEVAKNFWKNVYNWVNQSTVPSLNTEITEKLVTLGMDSNLVSNPVMDLILLCAKHNIIKLRKSVPSVQEFKCIDAQKYATELYKGNWKNLHETEERWQKCKAFDSVRI